ECLHVRGERVSEDEEIQQRREHRRGHGLEAHLPEAQHLLVQERGKAPHAGSLRSARMIFTNTSSSSGSATSRLATSTPPARRLASAFSTWAMSAIGMRQAPPASALALAASAAGSVPFASFTRSTRSENDASRFAVESSATMRPSFIIAIREQSCCASSR